MSTSSTDRANLAAALSLTAQPWPSSTKTLPSASGCIAQPLGIRHILKFRLSMKERPFL